MLCQPVTGRTHQIRLHLKHLACPIANDPLYGPLGSTNVTQSAKVDTAGEARQNAEEDTAGEARQNAEGDTAGEARQVAEDDASEAGASTDKKRTMGVDSPCSRNKRHKACDGMCMCDSCMYVCMHACIGPWILYWLFRRQEKEA